MPSAARFCALGLALFLVLLATSAPAAAAPKRISGKLSKSGYTVIALAANGEATSVRAKRRGFRLRPPAKRVTLHLRARNGRYAGPIVLGSRRKGRRAILGVQAGARLGGITVRGGYARVRRKLRGKWVVASRRARAKRGVPIGARRFGRVRSRPSRGTVRGDLELDGIPDPLDIDDDGDLVLDNIERSTTARAAQTGNEIGLNSDLTLELHQTANANAASLTEQQIEEVFRTFGRLDMSILPGDAAELDCGGLVYCSLGGTGRLLNAPSPPFPDCCDPDGDGFGTLTPAPNIPQLMSLLHGATTAQIGTGDVLVERVTIGGTETEFPATLQFVFATVPALVSYSDTAGNSATVSYPVTGPDPGPGGPGTRGNGFPVAAGADGNIVLTLTFWRPQRRPIPPETGDWIDIGGLTYAVGTEGGDCPLGAFSTGDPNLTPAPPAPGFDGGFTDLTADRPSNVANTFTYTLNVTACLASKGRSWSPGETQTLSFKGGPGGQSGTQQLVSFRRR